MSVQNPIGFFVPSHSSYDKIYSEIYRPYSQASRKLQLKQVGGHMAPNPGESAPIRVDGLSNLRMPGDEFIRLEYETQGHDHSLALKQRGNQPIETYLKNAVDRYKALADIQSPKVDCDAHRQMLLDQNKLSSPVSTSASIEDDADTLTGLDQLRLSENEKAEKSPARNRKSNKPEVKRGLKAIANYFFPALA
jgi:hypothetical protein